MDASLINYVILHARLCHIRGKAKLPSTSMRVVMKWRCVYVRRKESYGYVFKMSILRRG
jgi:hypothetical protein